MLIDLWFWFTGLDYQTRKPNHVIAKVQMSDTALRVWPKPANPQLRKPDDRITNGHYSVNSLQLSIADAIN